MIKILSKERCCGCSACLHICPKQSISFKEDKEGFLYPKVNMDTCIECGLCEQVCPVLNQNSERLPLHVFAAKHPNEKIRMSSSSGGIFTLLAEQIIDEGGVVFGARFDDNWEVVHDFAETKKGLISFRGSKYVQSRIGDAYVNAERFLKSGRKVMFTGTPCQIAGLKKYLKKEYENLIAMDFVCHGVPSPMVWRKYLEEELDRQGKVGKKSVLTGISFRDKSTGWKNYSFVLNFSNSTYAGEQTTVLSSTFYKNIYMNAFLSNLSLRPSCYACPAKSGRSEADITVGDFWGIENIMPDFDDDKGVSVIFVHKTVCIQYLKCEYRLVAYADAISSNGCVTHSVPVPLNRDYFYNCVLRQGCSSSLANVRSLNVFLRFHRFMYRKLHSYIQSKLK